jgi:FkbM family methyltransferase
MFDHIQALLKNNGYTPDTVLDIGAHVGKWTEDCMKVYPTSKYYLFEPIEYQELDKYKNNNCSVFNVLLYEKETEVDWYEMKNTGDTIFKELTSYFSDCKPTKKKTTTLSDVIGPYLQNIGRVFIKIDCQGAEIPILKGAGDILKVTDFILLEIPLFGKYNENVPNFLEHIQYMDSIGFIPFDILNVHYISNFGVQCDMLFVKKTHRFNDLVQKSLLRR